MEFYKAEENRYADMIYRRCGRSGILLPAVSLGKLALPGEGNQQEIRLGILCG